MALTKAQPGGGDVDFDEIKKAMLALADKEAKVVFRTIELHEETQLGKNMVQPVTADMVVCTGPNKGKILRNFRHIGRGVTGPLRRAWANGEKEVAAKLETKFTSGNPWVAAQTPNDDDFEMIERFYGEGGKDPKSAAAWNGPDLVEPDAMPASGGLAKAGDDEPPF